MQEVERGKYHLVEEDGHGALKLLFIGIFNSITDAFIGGGIIKQRDDDGKRTYMMANEDDMERYTDDYEPAE